jgi:hypothetical protein
MSEKEELVVITGLKAEQRQVEAIYVKKKVTRPQASTPQILEKGCCI